jgi:hypothetical protein
MTTLGGPATEGKTRRSLTDKAASESSYQPTSLSEGRALWARQSQRGQCEPGYGDRAWAAPGKRL